MCGVGLCCPLTAAADERRREHLAIITVRDEVDGDIRLPGRRASACRRNAADAFELHHVFENAWALVNSPEIDLVVITVKVPYHHEMVTAALADRRRLCSR
ncbi:hypothetical protein [Pseudorhizobium xiangyangii]|uniref:hypothetical protein n=1 Tax=Pseudorhizobium xiangyangii TaxID=2883104 RepID=UPI0036F215E9